MIHLEALAELLRKNLGHWHSTKVFLDVRKNESTQVEFSAFTLRLNLESGKSSYILKCPDDLRTWLEEFFQENPEIGAIRGETSKNINHLQTLSLKKLKYLEEDEQDDLKLLELERLAKVMYTGRPGDFDYDPNSTTPVISKNEVQKFKNEVRRKRKSRK